MAEDSTMVEAIHHHTRTPLAVRQRMPKLQSRFEFLVSSDCPPCSITWMQQGRTVIRSRRAAALLVRKRACIPPISAGRRDRCKDRANYDCRNCRCCPSRAAATMSVDLLSGNGTNYSRRPEIITSPNHSCPKEGLLTSLLRHERDSTGNSGNRNLPGPCSDLADRRRSAECRHVFEQVRQRPSST